MLRLDDGTHFIYHPFAATNSAQAFRCGCLTKFKQSSPVFLDRFTQLMLLVLMLVRMVRMRTPVLRRYRVSYPIV
ncbi:hypothetical protein [Thermocoleostomius sinensis]|uniref:Uncharacterized protein n=1 Tax=Thermocoleostomius sinensis A174 TaxID=2016057 RepID=A0A9E8ZFI1_9CYAN|nr:hypothetical protein [Thermocoleostomius sinensis]WAL62425.1 hypothetical protein OXH18_10670 [Thermocoleostomius sinensis A174]